MNLKGSVLILYFVLVFVSCSHSQQTVDISFSQKVESKESVVGFLHYGDLREIKDQIKVLKPKFWRGSVELFTANSQDAREESYKILKENRIKVILVLSDLIREVQKKKNWNESINNMNSVKDIVTRVYAKYGNEVIYDIWNEPNYNGCWIGSRNDFFKAFKFIYNIIRALPGGEDAIIMGPSTDGYHQDYMEDFLSFCSENDMNINILSWHQNGGALEGIKLAKDINDAKINLLKKYSKVGIKDIYIPEIIGMDDNYNPLTAMSLIINLENAGGSAGCKACWGDDCGNNRMDGILDFNKRPRGIWWFYKFYAQSLSFRLNTETSTKYISTIGYFSNAKKDTLNVMVGNFGNENINADINLTNVLISANFRNNKKLRYTLSLIPNSNQNPLEKITRLNNSNVILKNNYVIVSNIQNSGVYILKIY